MVCETKLLFTYEGHKHTAKAKEQIGKKSKERWNNLEYRQNVVEQLKGKHTSPDTEFKKGHIPWNKNQGHSRVSLSKYTWLKILEREQPQCLLCNCCDKKRLVVYHNDGDKTNNNNSNLVILCKQCFSKDYIKKGHFKKGMKSFNHPNCIKNRFKKGIIPWCSLHSDKMPRGEKHHNWRNGISFEPYSPEFHDKLKEQIRQRDEFYCWYPSCNSKKYANTIHHIDYNKKNNIPKNLIILHGPCNVKSNFDRGFHQRYFENVQMIRGIK